MFCKNCGKELDEGMLFCSLCGARQQTVPTETVAEEVSDTNLSASEDTSANFVVSDSAAEESEIEYSVAEPEFQPKKKNTKKIVGIVSAIVAVAAVAAVVVLNFNLIVGYFIKWFGSDQDYFVYVVKQNATNAFNTATGTMSDVKGDIENKTVTTTMQVQLGEDLLDLIDNYIGQDFEWINDAKFSITAGQNKDLTKIGLSVMMGKKDLVNAEGIVDIKEQTAYVGVPGLNESYLEFDLEELGVTEEVMEAMASSELEKVMPSEKEINALFEKYLTVALRAVEVDGKSTQKETVGGITNSYTVLKSTITDETVYKMAIAVLEELMEDKQVRNKLEEIYDYAVENDYIDDDDFELDDLYDLIEEGIDEMEDYLDDYADGEELATLRLYVNGKHEIVGYIIDDELADQEIIYAMYAEKGGKWAALTEMNYMGGVVICEGSGDKKMGKISGEYVVSFENDEIDIEAIIVELEKLDEKKAREGRIDGTIRIKLGKDAFDLIKSNPAASMIVGIADPAIELICVDKNNYSKVTVNVLLGDDVYAGITIENEVSGKKSIKLPKKTVDGTDFDDLQDWLMDIDFDKLLDTLEDAGVDGDIIDMLEEYIDMIG